MTPTEAARAPSPTQPLEFRKKDGSLSKMRSHAGNIPTLPQTKQCSFCPAKFTRTTHLNRHLRNHTNERVHKCDLCGAQFTRSDLLSRHKKGCNNSSSPIRRKSCQECTQSKIKCNRELPCSKCVTRGKECVYQTKKPHRTRSSTVNTLESQHQVSSNVPSAISTVTLPVPVSSESALAGAIDELSVSSSRDYSSVASTEASSQILVSSHLTSLYNNDMFEPFFSNVFSTMENASIPLTSDGRSQQSPACPDEDILALHNPGREDIQDFHDNFVTQNISAFTSPTTSIQPIISNTRQPSPSALTISETERRHYLHLFYTGYVEQVPVVHAPSFSPEGRPSFLIHCMQACGAIYLKTKAASTFMLETLKASRQILSEELSKDTLSVEDQLIILLTVVLLHTLGMFHEDSEERALSIHYHAMLISMIRRANFISHTSSWSLDDYRHLSLEEQWRHWALHEMAKRALLLSYLQDSSRCIYFTLPSSYQPMELDYFGLPCDNKLWYARSASEWWAELHKESSYGNAQERLNCPTLSSISSLIFLPRTPDVIIPISPFGHWALIHGVLSRLFTVCTEGRSQDSSWVDQELYSVQFALHNWLLLWMKRPEALDPNTNEESDLSFMQNPLPFYWLGQVALMAYQENLPPFEVDTQASSSTSTKMNVRFFQVKKWLRLIRIFLSAHSNNAPTIVWDELMSIRLRDRSSWQVDLERPANDDPNGLLGFWQ